MKFVAEYILSHPVAEISNALAKAQKNPYLVREIVDMYRKEHFNLKPSENPYAEDTSRLDITEKDARYLAAYYDYVDNIEKKEKELYRKNHPNNSSFFDGIKIYTEKIPTGGYAS